MPLLVGPPLIEHKFVNGDFSTEFQRIILIIDEKFAYTIHPAVDNVKSEIFRSSDSISAHFYLFKIVKCDSSQVYGLQQENGSLVILLVNWWNLLLIL